MTNEYHAHPEQIPVPYATFVRMDRIDKSERKEQINTSLLGLYLMPRQYEIEDNLLTLEISGNHFSTFICVLHTEKEELASPIVAIVTDYDDEMNPLGS